MAQIPHANRVQGLNGRTSRRPACSPASWLPPELISSKHLLSLWLWEPALPFHPTQLGTAQGACQSWVGG